MAKAKSKTKPRVRKTRASSSKKKTPTKKVRGVGASPGELPFPMKIRGNLLLRIKAAAAELGEMVAKGEAARITLEMYLAMPQHAPVAKAISDRRRLNEETTIKRAEFAQIQLQCGEKLGLKPEELSNYSLDTQTGVFLPVTTPT